MEKEKDPLMLWRIYGYRSPENKWYIGRTNLPMTKRSCGKNGWGYLQMKDSPFAEAIQKYGFENMEQNILMLCESLEEAKYYERYYTLEKNSIYPNGYNRVLGQSVPQQKKERNYKPKQKKGIPVGTVHSAEWNSNISKALKDKYTSEEMFHPSKAVLQYIRKDLKPIGQFRSLREAEKITGVNRICIKRCCEGKAYKAGNYYWEYA